MTAPQSGNITTTPCPALQVPCPTAKPHTKDVENLEKLRWRQSPVPPLSTFSPAPCHHHCVALSGRREEHALGHGGRGRDFSLAGMVDAVDVIYYCLGCPRFSGFSFSQLAARSSIENFTAVFSTSATCCSNLSPWRSCAFYKLA